MRDLFKKIVESFKKNVETLEEYYSLEKSEEELEWKVDNRFSGYIEGDFSVGGSIRRWK